MTNITTLEDTIAIQRLLGLYCQHADDEKYDEWVELFDADGFLNIMGQNIAGPGALKNWLVSVKAGTALRHLMFNPVITIDSATVAHGTVDAIYLGGKANIWAITASPRYDDTFVKVGHEWKFSSRHLQIRMPSQVPARSA
jgi:hypothetical protein